jgi:hypothetical protein
MQPPSLLSPPGPGSVRLCNAMETKLLHSPSLLADRHPNQTICPTRNSCDVLTEIAGQSGSDFSHRGERSTLYTVYNTLDRHLAGSFWVLRQNLQQVAPNQEKPHTTPFHYLIYSIYISVVIPQRLICIFCRSSNMPSLLSTLLYYPSILITLSFCIFYLIEQ